MLVCKKYSRNIGEYNMKINETVTTNCKLKHTFLFVELIMLSILIQVDIYIALNSIVLENKEIFQLIVLSVVNPITELVCTLVAIIMYII